MDRNLSKIGQGIAGDNPFDGHRIFFTLPRPQKCIHDNGKEFTGEEFEDMLESYGIKSKSTTVKNPQTNVMHERAHLLMAEILRTQKIKVRERESARLAI